MRLQYSLVALLFCVGWGSVRIPRIPAVAPVDASPQILTYHLTLGEPLRYKLTADIKGAVPILNSATPVDLCAEISLVYLATPKTLLADGTADIEFKVESADIEIGATEKEKIPFPIPLEQIQDILNQTVTLAKTGEVKNVQGGAPLPFGVSVPGVDPKRLYTLLFPIVFQGRPVKAGDTWKFQSELLGSEGTKPVFSATMISPSPEKQQPQQITSVNAPPLLPIHEEFSMQVDQKLDADKKPVMGDAAVYKTRKGHIEGSGTLRFDPNLGRFIHSEVKILAQITEKILGKPLTPDEPTEMTSKVQATVIVELQPAAGGGGPVAAGKQKEKP